MTHLTPDELIDSLEGALPQPRQAHVEACAVCRAEQQRLGTLMRDVAAVDVPEPSPLFWDHLSARIRERVALEPPPTTGGWLSGWWPRLALASGVLAICTALGWMGWSGLQRHRATTAAAGAAAVTTSSPAPLVTSRPAPESTARAAVSTSGDPRALALEGPAAPADDEWTLMVRMAEDVEWDEVESSLTDVRPGAVERALNELSSDERRAVLALMQADLARPPS